MSLSLPATLVKDGRQRVANTATDYWTLRYQGFQDANSEAGQAELSPQQKGALTRAANRAAKEAEKSSDGDGQTKTAGDAAGGGDLTDANDDPSV